MLGAKAAPFPQEERRSTRRVRQHALQLPAHIGQAGNGGLIARDAILQARGDGRLHAQRREQDAWPAGAAGKTRAPGMHGKAGCGGNGMEGSLTGWFIGTVAAGAQGGDKAKA